METKTRAAGRKAEGAPIRGAMATIVGNHATPVAKSEPQDQPMPVDAKLEGKALAAAAINVCKGELRNGAQWPMFGRKIRALASKEAREVFITSVDEFVASLRKIEREAGAEVKDGKAEPSKDQSKRAAQVVATATVELSKLRTIAKAWNATASDEGLIDFFAQTRRGVKVGTFAADDVPHAYVYQYAAGLMKAAAGRKMERFGTVLAKLLEQRKPREEAGDGEADNKAHAALVAIVAELVASYPVEPSAKGDPLTKAELLGL